MLNMRKAAETDFSESLRPGINCNVQQLAVIVGRWWWIAGAAPSSVLLGTKGGGKAFPRGRELQFILQALKTFEMKVSLSMS